MNRVLIVLCFALLACGKVVAIDGDGGTSGTIDGGGGGTPDASLEELCAGPSIALENLEQCFIKLECEFIMRCFPGFPDAATCEENIFEFFALLSGGGSGGGGGGGGGGDGGGDDGPSRLFFETLKRAIQADVTNYNGDRAFACLDGMRRGSCDTDGGGADCEYIATGSTPPGGACSDDFECQEGDNCDSVDSSSCDLSGTCQAGLGLGASCDFDRCQKHLRCVRLGGTSIAATCEDGSMGSKCSDSRECNADLFCGAAQQCVAKRSPGAVCGITDECPGDERCIFGTCSRVDIAGEPCEDRCLGNLYCAANVCQQLPGFGQNCSTVPASQQGSRCDSIENICGPAGTCVSRTPPGSPCPAGGGDTCQLGSFCTSDLGEFNLNPTCSARRLNNMTCNSPNHCQSGFCEFSALPPFCATFTACWE